MKFFVKNDFYLNRIKKIKGEIIDILPDKISELQNANVLGPPVKEIQVETATVGPKENEIIRQAKGKKRK
jgi:hypothetical protein